MFNKFFSIGDNVKLLIDRPDGIYCFREKKGRVYYISEKILPLASMVNPDRSISKLWNMFWKIHKVRKVQVAHYCTVSSGSIRPGNFILKFILYI